MASFYLAVHMRAIRERGKLVSVILTGQFYEETNEYDVLCWSCKQSVGRATRAELSEMTARGYEVYCFECDNLCDDMVPEHLIPKRDEVIIVRDDYGREKAAILWLADRVGLVGVRVCTHPINKLDGAQLV